VIPIGDENRAHRTPLLTVGIIVACGLVFLWQLSLDPLRAELAARVYGMTPALLIGAARLHPSLEVVPPWATIGTSMFMHGGWAHLLGNMLYLWIFGNNIEDRLGHLRFALFYVAAGAFAAAAQIVPEPGSTIPMIGASGAISGVLGAYLVLFPRAQILVFIPFSFMVVHRLPASWVLGFWFAFQVLSGLLSDPSSGGVAWWAHVGGFLGGMLMAVPLRRAAPRRGPWG
jgi:membrane associated rhomboid family serine protease